MRTLGLASHRHLTGSSRRHAILIGPRQVGKTTVLLQTIRELLREAPPRSICYLRLDDPDLTGVRLGQLVELYRREIWSGDRLAYLLLDEIQDSEGWAKQLKAWVDSDSPNRVLATGSVAPEILDGSRESGPGRWDELAMAPLDFREYALLRGRAREDDVSPPQEEWWEHPPAGLQVPEQLWLTYLLQGGFPAAALDNDLASAHQRLREDIYDRVLVRDMAVYFGLRSFDTLRHLFRYLAEQSSGIANYSVLSTRLGSPSTTVMDMLQRLRETFLVGQSLPWGRGKAMLRPRPKLYLCDSSLRSAVLLHGPGNLEQPEVIGPTLETATYSHLAGFARSRGGELAYWRDARGEVDFVLTLPGRAPLPIEVMAGADPRSKAANIARCAADVGATKALILNAGPDTGLGEIARLKLIRWPLPEFLWTLGIAERARARGEVSHG